MHVAVQILATARSFEKKAHEIFRPHGLTPAQFNVLNCLEGQEEGRRASDLAKDLVVDPSNITGLLKRMKKEGLVREIENARDRRQHVVGMTAKGAAAWKDCARDYERSLRALEAEISGRELATLGRALKKLAERVERLPN